MASKSIVVGIDAGTVNNGIAVFNAGIPIFKCRIRLKLPSDRPFSTEEFVHELSKYSKGRAILRMIDLWANSDHEVLIVTEWQKDKDISKHNRNSRALRRITIAWMRLFRSCPLRSYRYLRTPDWQAKFVGMNGSTEYFNTQLAKHVEHFQVFDEHVAAAMCMGFYVLDERSFTAA